MVKWLHDQSKIQLHSESDDSMESKSGDLDELKLLLDDKSLGLNDFVPLRFNTKSKSFTTLDELKKFQILMSRLRKTKNILQTLNLKQKLSAGKKKKEKKIFSNSRQIRKLANFVINKANELKQIVLKKQELN